MASSIWSNTKQSKGTTENRIKMIATVVIFLFLTTNCFLSASAQATINFNGANDGTAGTIPAGGGNQLAPVTPPTNLGANGAGLPPLNNNLPAPLPSQLPQPGVG